MCIHVCIVLSLYSVCVYYLCCVNSTGSHGSNNNYHIVMNCKHDSKVSDLALSEQAVLHEAGEKE